MNYKVKYKNTEYYLNKNLIKSKNLSDDTVKQLVKLHENKLRVFETMEDTEDTHQLRALASMVKQIEFKLQELWKFELDETYHEWYNVPKCTCPKMDNRERCGTKYQIVSGDCPIHKVLLND